MDDLNDFQLIRANLQLSGRSREFGKPWPSRWYILAFCFAPAPLILFFALNAYDSSFLTLFGQFALAAGTYLALFQLRRKPLLNPIQSIVFLFHWWFAVGPALAVLFAALRNDEAMLSKYITSGGEALWIVALGLPLYAFCAIRTIGIIRGRIKPVAFIMPQGALYRPRTIFAYWLLGGILMLVIIALGQYGIVGNQAINYLGGTMSENPFVSAVEAMSGIAMFATVGMIGYLAGPAREDSLKFKLIAIALILFNTASGFTTGFKGAMVLNFSFLFVVLFVWRQKVPLLITLITALFFLFIVEPFVSETRFEAERGQITTPEERAKLFSSVLGERLRIGRFSNFEVNIESPFRGIFTYADGITSVSSIFRGPWSGTISEGLLTLIPRAIYPDKPESNMGNYFARYLGVSSPFDYINNVGVSIPFEFVGNYGYLVGILSFGLIGILWSIFCVWFLSEGRLATHPLTPLFIMFSMRVEASVGQFLISFRDLPLVLGAAFGLWIILKKRL